MNMFVVRYILCVNIWLLGGMYVRFTREVFFFFEVPIVSNVKKIKQGTFRTGKYLPFWQT
jgi:hypothetical protein